MINIKINIEKGIVRTLNKKPNNISNQISIGPFILKA